MNIANFYSPLLSPPVLLSSQEEESPIFMVWQVLECYFDSFSVIKMIPPSDPTHWNQGACGPMTVIVSVNLLGASKSELCFFPGHGLPGANVFHDSMNLVLDLATPCVNRGRTWKGDLGHDLAHMVGTG